MVVVHWIQDVEFFVRFFPEAHVVVFCYIYDQNKSLLKSCFVPVTDKALISFSKIQIAQRQVSEYQEGGVRPLDWVMDALLTAGTPGLQKQYGIHPREKRRELGSQ